MKVIPMRVPTARALWSADGIILAVELLGVIGVFAATVLFIILLCYSPASGVLWLGLPLCLALLAGSALRVRFDWQRINADSRDGEPETRPDGSPV